MRKIHRLKRFAAIVFCATALHSSNTFLLYYGRGNKPLLNQLSDDHRAWCRPHVVAPQCSEEITYCCWTYQDSSIAAHKLRLRLNIIAACRFYLQFLRGARLRSPRPMQRDASHAVTRRRRSSEMSVSLSAMSARDRRIPPPLRLSVWLVRRCVTMLLSCKWVETRMVPFWKNSAVKY